MNAFTIELSNRPGEMARVTEILARRGVNILIYGLGAGERGIVGFFASDEAGTRAALSEVNVTYHEAPALAVRMLDKPGQAAAVSRQLADAGVNIVAWLPVDTSREHFTVAIGVDNAEAAKRTLGEQIVDWSYS